MKYFKINYNVAFAFMSFQYQCKFKIQVNLLSITLKGRLHKTTIKFNKK